MNPLTDLLKSHRSIRKYTDQPVPDDLLEEIMRCGQAAPTSSNIQTTTVIRVRDSQTRARIAELAGGQGYVADAGAFLVFCADLHRIRLACAMQGADFAGSMTEHFVSATVDVALVAQNCVVAAEALGLGTCYIGGVRNNPQPICELLALPELVYPVFGLCLGYPAQDPQVKPRLPMSVVFREERYQQPEALDGIKEYDRQLRAYYQSRTGGRKDSSWSEEMKAWAERPRAHMRAFLAQRGFTMQ